MAVICANCGEELLGAVNRCWRCGQHVLSAPGSGEAPPIRQLPPPTVVVQMAAAPTIVIAESGDAVDESVASSESSAPPATTTPIPPVARAAATPPASELPPRPAVYAQRGVVDAAAIASIVLGALALLVGVFFSGAVVLGFLGLAAGLWGFKSQLRQLAVIGVLVSLMGIAGSSARLAFDAFTWWYGQSPLGPATAPDVESTLPDSLE